MQCRRGGTAGGSNDVGTISVRVHGDKARSSGDLVAISGKRKWQACETYQCEAALNDNALSNVVYAKSARVSGIFNAIANSLVQTGVPSDIFRRFSGPVTTNMLDESPDNVGLAEDSWNGLFSSLKFDFQFDANPRMLWLYTISLSSKVTTKEELLRATLRSRFAVVTQKEVTKPWIHVILEKVRMWTWDVLDEMGDDRIKTVDCKEDNGPLAEWDVMYKSPTEGDMGAVIRESQKKLQHQVTTDNQINESPRRKAARNHACIYQKRGGRQMKDMVSMVNGDIEVGCVVQVTLKNMDSTKVDGKNITLGVVEKVTPINNAPPKYRLACAKGPMQDLYSRMYITVVKDACPKSLGMDNILTCWRGKATVTEREAAASTSLVGGQGVKRCGCRGSCNTKHCACKKWDFFVVQLAMVECITVAQTMKNSFPCSISRW